LKRDIALEIFSSSVALDRDRLARFSREAELLASLNHPNIAVIHGVEEARDDAGETARALVMELVDGHDLTEQLRRGPLPTEEALSIARQIAEALEAAHQRGIVHRDLKLANIKVRTDGTVKILDFGIAKAVETQTGSGGARDGEAEPPTLTSHGQTSAGTVLGTAAYMSPCRNWSLGGFAAAS
jgi:serine/threonine protein kinase